MGQLIPNTFSSFALTDEEVIQGSVLTETQKQLIQNQISVVAEEKLALEIDPTEPLPFIQQEAWKSGYIAALQYLLELSEAAVESINLDIDPED